jgi:hypothetical protein
VYRVGAAAAVAYRRDARVGLRSPLARLAWQPLWLLGGFARGLGLGEPAPAPSVRATAAERIAAVLAREVHLASSVGVAHAALARTIDRTARGAAPAVADAVDGVGVRPDRRRWWTVAAWSRGLAELTAVTGGVWLALLGLADWLQLPEPPTPRVTEALTLPTALLLGGLAIRLLLGVLSRAATSRGARRHRAATERRIRDRLATAVAEHLTAPFDAELARYAELRAAVATLADRDRHRHGRDAPGDERTRT